MSEYHQQTKIASRGQRILNLFIDCVPICLLVFVITRELNTTTLKFNIIYGLIAFFYYFIFELFFSKTPAKFLTKTRVVTENGEVLDRKRILLRSIIRLIPFEGVTFLLAQYPRGMHDWLSKTLVIDESIHSTNPPLRTLEKLFKLIMYIVLLFFLFMFISLVVFAIRGWK